MKEKRPWTHHDIAALKQLCSSGAHHETIMVALNRSGASIWHKTAELNLRESVPVKVWKPELQASAVAMHKRGASAAHIATKLGFSTQTVCVRLNRAGLSTSRKSCGVDLPAAPVAAPLCSAARVLELHRRGTPITAIAALLRVPNAAVLAVLDDAIRGTA